MRTIAFYLPQFHTIPENDEWWGTGFTEWVNVKKSKPQFKGHCQPEIPYDNNYYDLSDVNVMKSQAELAKKYGVEGFCYYHYWFEGKLLLQKPLEQMLNDSAVDIPFMMCWANESWARTWDGAETQLLIKQNYNQDVEGWRKHFEYLLSFFKDDRYIKVDSKPVLIVYKPHLIDNINQMIEQWDKWAAEEGFSGIYWGFQHHTAFEHIEKLSNFQFGVEFEPFYTTCLRNVKPSFFKRVQRKIFHLPTIYDYDTIWNLSINNYKYMENQIKIMPGAFTAWDNTPRRGNEAIVFFESSPEKFETYLLKKLRDIKDNKPEFLFINAWNEWAEGAHLEPDESNKMGYLQALKNVLIKTGNYWSD